MPQKTEAAARARAEAMFKHRQQQAADAPKAMAEYRAAERAKYDRMSRLRALRLARDSRARRAEPSQAPNARRAPPA
jgi:hypothetical protein